MKKKIHKCSFKFTVNHFACNCWYLYFACHKIELRNSNSAQYDDRKYTQYVGWYELNVITNESPPKLIRRQFRSSNGNSWKTCCVNSTLTDDCSVYRTVFDIGCIASIFISSKWNIKCDTKSAFFVLLVSFQYTFSKPKQPNEDTDFANLFVMTEQKSGQTKIYQKKRKICLLYAPSALLLFICVMSQKWNEIALNLTIKVAFDVADSSEPNRDRQCMCVSVCWDKKRKRERASERFVVADAHAQGLRVSILYIQANRYIKFVRGLKI